jgi:single-strand DNA-binding protein
MINRLTLIGNAGQDPEIRKLENGTSVAKVSLATKESWKDKDGEWQSTTEWHNLVLWRDLADRAGNIKKGSLVYVEGKVTYRKYTDKDGVERNATDIVVSSFRVLDKKEGNAKETGVPVEDGMGGRVLDDENSLPF